MVEVTKLGGDSIFVNADHIESIEAQPDTVMVLTNGKHFIVRESVAEVVNRVLEYQSQIRSGKPPTVTIRGPMKDAKPERREEDLKSARFKGGQRHSGDQD